MARHRMSEKERAYWFAFLFPPLWPLGIAMLLCDAFEAIGNGIRALWQWLRRRS